MELQGKLSISRPIGSDCNYISIRIEDEASRTRFLEIKIDLAEFSEALTGLACRPCLLDAKGLEHVGKKKYTDIITFEIGRDDWRSSNHKKLAYTKLKEICEKYYPDWTASDYFGSQDSFLKHGDKYYAKGHIYKYTQEIK